MSAATTTPAKIATPPRSGVIRCDSPRSRGSSSAPRRRAARPTNGVRTAVTTAAAAAASRASSPSGAIEQEASQALPPSSRGRPPSAADLDCRDDPGRRAPPADASTSVRIWIDLTAPAHPVVFRPIVERLSAAGHDVEVTARDYAQTLALARRLGLEHHAVGTHGGAKRTRKLVSLVSRSFELWRWARGRRFDLAAAHGSNDLAVVAKGLGIPAVDMFDYEWATLQHNVGCRPARRVMTPDTIPPERLRRYGVGPEKLAQFPGLKEDYYLADFEPDRGVLDELGLDPSRVLVAVRPPPDVSLYHRKANRLFPQVLDHIGKDPNVQAAVLPRTEQQRRFLQWLSLPSLVVPDRAVDGQSLVALVDLVVSAGGTMNREAVALGTPVYTTYGGRLGGVDEALIREGRLRPLSDPRAIELVKRDGAGVIQRRDPQLLVDLMLGAAR